MLRSFIFALLTFLALPALAQEPAPPEPAGDEAVVEEPTPEPVDHVGDAIRAAFARIDALAPVQVTFGDGVVSLKGTVARTTDRTDAETIAQKIDGVLFVDNEIEVAQDTAPLEDATARDAAIREQLERIFANVSELAGVTVEVRSGVVKLGGTVLAASAVTNAETLARATDGVVYVENAITEERAVSERISPALARTQDVLSSFLASLPLIGVGLAIIVFFVLVGGALTRLKFPYRRIENKPLILGIVKQVVRLLMVVIGIVLVLELFDLTALVGAVLGGAGVAGLALGFAFKDIAENYLASLMLSIRRPFEKDDWVLIGDLEGKVVRLTTRETVLMTLDGNHLRVPNAKVFQSVITNFTRNPLRRIGFVVGVGVGEDLAECLRIGGEALRKTKGVVEEPTAFGVVEELSDFTVNLHFFVWIDQRKADYFLTRSESIRRLKLAFDRAGIDMPEPTQRVLQSQFTMPASKPLPDLDIVAPADTSAPSAPSAQVDAAIEEDRKAADEQDLL